MKTNQHPSTDEWINKMWYEHTIEHYLAIKKNAVLIHARTWRTLESIKLSKIRQIRNDKYSMIPHTDYLE